MDNTSERMLRNVIYYSLILLILALSGLFVARVATTGGIALWIQIIYYIWTAILILALGCNTVGVIMKKSRSYLGYLWYVILLLAVIMADVLFMNLNVINSLGTITEVTFMGILMLCFIPAILGIIAYRVSEKIITE